MYILYSILLAVGFVLALPWFLWKGRTTGKYMRTFRERMGRLPVYLNVDGDRSIWIHAVSVGEALAARPLVPALRERFPGYRLFLSTTTMTGNAVAAQSARDLDGLFYAPFDWPGPVRQALSSAQPRAARPGRDGAVAQPHPRGAPARHARGGRQRADLRTAPSAATGGSGASSAGCSARSTSS